MNERDHRLDDYFMLYRTTIMKNVYVFVRDYHAAEDICQDAFARLSGNLDHVPPEKVKAWLLVVSERLAKDYLRKGGKYRRVMEVEFSEEFVTDLVPDPLDLLIEREERAEKKRVIGCLKFEKPHWYNAMMMRYMEQMNDIEIREELGIKASLASKWRERAKKWVLGKYAGDEKERDS